jgi:hypothetical protein
MLVWTCFVVAETSYFGHCCEMLFWTGFVVVAEIFKTPNWTFVVAEMYEFIKPLIRSYNWLYQRA